MSSHHIKRPVTFLSLAPIQSESYPKAPVSPTTKSSVEGTIAETVAKPVETIVDPTRSATARRHSSTSSVGSQRFLKLGPVHWGGDNNGDDYAIEE